MLARLERCHGFIATAPVAGGVEAQGRKARDWNEFGKDWVISINGFSEDVGICIADERS